MATSPSLRESNAPTPAVEAFARDFLHLVRGVRTYPAGHPFLEGVVEKVLCSAPWGPEGAVALGVTRSDLLVDGELAGGAGTRASDLASLLYERQVGRIVVTRDATARDLLEAATLLASKSVVGAALCQELASRGICSVLVEPLNLERIHAASVWGARAEDVSPDDRLRQTWDWLQNRDITAEELAEILTAQELWSGGREGDDRELRARAVLLAGLGDRLEQALGFLSEERREQVLERVAEMGRSLAPTDLAGLLATDHASSWLRGLGASALVRHLDPERFVDLLASLTALGDRGSRRLAGVFRRFAPQGGTRSALSLVSSRLLSGNGRGFTQEVWKSVEEFLLRLEEDPFMAQDYADLLEAAEDDDGSYQGRDDELTDDCGPHLDGVFLGVAADGGSAWRERLLDRLSARLEGGGASRAVAYANRIEDSLPGVVAQRPALVREVFRRGLAAARESSRRQLQELLRFCRSHEMLLVGPALRALEEEQRIASRRLIVEIMAGFSAASTPAIVARARSAPWFVTRNLVIVMGRQGGARVLPALREFQEHRHPKVRREARRALGGLPRGTVS